MLAFLVFSSKTEAPVSMLICLLNGFLVIPWALLCSYPHVCVWSHIIEKKKKKKKKCVFKEYQRISSTTLEKVRRSVPTRNSSTKIFQLINSKLTFSWSRPHYNFNSIFSFFYYFQMMGSDFIACSTYTIKWEVNQGQVVCQKTSKTQTLHVTVYFCTFLEEIFRSATPNFGFRMPWNRLLLKLPCLYLFE